MALFEDTDDLKAGLDSFAGGIKDVRETYEAVATVISEGKDLLESTGFIPPSGGSGTKTIFGIRLPSWVPDSLVQAEKRANTTEPSLRNPVAYIARLLKALVIAGADLAIVQKIAGLDPNAGLAPAGTAITSLAPAAQRRVFANAFVIDAARFMASPEAFAVATQQSYEQQDSLGAQLMGTPGCKITDDLTDVVNDGLTPEGKLCRVQPTHPDIAKAAMRLVLVANGTIPRDGLVGAPGSDPLGDFLQESMEGDAEDCFKLGSPKSRLDCIDGFQAKDPTTVDRLLKTHKAWEAGAEPNRTLQTAQGFDGNKYVVALNKLGIRTTYAAIGAAAVTGAAIFAGMRLAKKKRKRGRKPKGLLALIG